MLGMGSEEKVTYRNAESDEIVCCDKDDENNVAKQPENDQTRSKRLIGIFDVLLLRLLFRHFAHGRESSPHDLFELAVDICLFLLDFFDYGFLALFILDDVG